jgi:hypothetical protein
MPDILIYNIHDIDLVHHLDARAVSSARPLWIFKHDVDRPMRSLL